MIFLRLCGETAFRASQLVIPVVAVDRLLDHDRTQLVATMAVYVAVYHVNIRKP